MSERESVARTVLVAGAVALGCSLVVSLAVTWLRPIQLGYRAVEQNRAVLVAAGLAEADAPLEDDEVVARYLELESRLVELDTGRFVAADASMIAAYDYRDAADDPVRSRPIAPELDLASIGSRPLLMPVWLQRDGARLEGIVLPVYGRGMWSTIRAFVVLDADLHTIDSLSIAEHGETPGIGDRIENPVWLSSWRGKRARDTDGSVLIRVAGPETADATRIDGITGATVTAEAVGRLVRYWLGPDGYGRFLDTLGDDGG